MKAFYHEIFLLSSPAILIIFLDKSCHFRYNQVMKEDLDKLMASLNVKSPKDIAKLSENQVLELYNALMAFIYEMD